MVICGVTIKHLQSIHKVMQSVDNTFISIIYFQIKSLYSKCMVQMLLSLCSLKSNFLCVVNDADIIQYFNTNFIYISETLQTKEGTNQE